MNGTLVQRLVLAGTVGLALLGGCGRNEDATPQTAEAVPVSTSTTRKFTNWEIQRLQDAKVSLEEAQQYSSRFDGADIARLKDKGISAEQANAFDSRYRGEHILTFAAAKVGADKANAYNPRFKASDVVELVHVGVTSETAGRYHSSFSGWDIGTLVRENFPPEQANQFKDPKLTVGREYSQWDVAFFGKRKVSVANLKAYHDSFRTEDLRVLVEGGVGADEANRYVVLNNQFPLVNVSAGEIVALNRAGIPFDEVARKAREKMIDSALAR